MTADRIKFTKMHALANDFMVVDGTTQTFQPTKSWIREAGDRHRGVGFDQLLVLEESRAEANVDFELTIYNSDGGIAEQCGNGTLCVARFVCEELSFPHQFVRFRTVGGEISATVQADGEWVKAELGIPSIVPADIPFLTKVSSLSYDLQINACSGTRDLTITPISMGNPHAVVFYEDLTADELPGIAADLQEEKRFPASVNVEFVEIVDRERLRLRVFERGAGETQACGTGACAAVTAARLSNLVDSEVHVEQAGGTAEIHWNGLGQPIALTGLTCRAFKGEIDIG